MLEPVHITADAILQYKGIRRYGAERRLLYEHVCDAMEKLRSLQFDADWAVNPCGRRGKCTVHWEGDRLFDLVKAELFQPDLFGGEQRVAIAWSVRAGQWARWWLNPEQRVWICRMARVLLEMDHRHNRGTATLAKKIGVYYSLLPSASTRPFEMYIGELLVNVGELPEQSERDRHWPGRTREHFDNAMQELEKNGMFRVQWPQGYGPDDADIFRARGWAARWLSKKVRLIPPETAPEAAEVRPVPKPHPHKTPPPERYLGGVLRTARHLRSWTQKQTAELLGISKTLVSYIENEKRLAGRELEKQIVLFAKSRPPLG